MSPNPEKKNIGGERGEFISLEIGIERERGVKNEKKTDVTCIYTDRPNRFSL